MMRAQVGSGQKGLKKLIVDETRARAAAKKLSRKEKRGKEKLAIGAPTKTLLIEPQAKDVKMEE